MAAGAGAARASLCPRHKGPARYYYKARIYSPLLGRFMQTDLIGPVELNDTDFQRGGLSVWRNFVGVRVSPASSGRRNSAGLPKPGGFSGWR